MKCLRCGKELVAKGTFCTVCDQTTSIPLRDSEYLSKKISIPKRTPVQKAKKTEVKSTHKAPSKAKPRLIFCALAFLLCAALFLQLVHVSLERKKALAEVERLSSIEDECVLLTDKLREAEARIRELEGPLTPEVSP